MSVRRTTLIALVLSIGIAVVMGRGTALAALVDGFDFPLGPPDATGYANNTLDFLDTHDYQSDSYLEYHPGEDWNDDGSGQDEGMDSNDAGDGVYAMADGVIETAEFDSFDWGYLVQITHDLVGTTTIWSQYGHLATIEDNPSTSTAWAVGDVVKRGDKIGTVGDYPHGSGDVYHLHWEWRIQYREADDFVFNNSYVAPYYEPHDPIWTADHYADPSDKVNASRPDDGSGRTTQTISSDITSNTTWTDDYVYHVTSSIAIDSGVTLTVDPGAIIKFDWPNRLTVNGTLDVNGTLAEPVYFTSDKDDSVGGDTDGGGPSTPSSEDWREVLINSTGAAYFDYAVVRYGGWDNGSDTSANIFNDGGTLAFNNSTSSDSYIGIWQNTDGALSDITDSEISNNDYAGVYVQEGEFNLDDSHINDNGSIGVLADAGTDDMTLTGNSFSRNTAYAIYAAVDAIISESDTALMDDNGVNGIFVHSSANRPSLTWSASIPYVLHGIIITSGTEVDVDPNTVLKLNQGGGTPLRVNDGGTLDVNGTSGNLVIFTSLKDDSVGGAGADTNNNGTSSGVPGDWTHIWIQDGGAAFFDYAVVRYGGYDHSSYYKANIFNDGGALTFTASESSYSDAFGIRQDTAGAAMYIQTDSLIAQNVYNGVYIQDGTAAISDTELSYNGEDGIKADEGCDGLTIDTLQVNDNDENAIEAIASVGITDSGTHSVDDNGINGIFLSGSISSSVTWASELVYVIGQSIAVQSAGDLTIDSGAIVKFPLGARQILVQGDLIANGATGTGNQVIFTSLRDDVGGDTDETAYSAASGDWEEIIIASTGTAEFYYSEVRYGGKAVGGSYSRANIHNDGGALTFNNSVSSYAEYGIRQSTSGATTTMNNSTIAFVDDVSFYVLDGAVSGQYNTFTDDAGARYGIKAESDADAISLTDGSFTGGFGTYTVIKSGSPTVNVENNWWGVSCGPYHASNCPSGTEKVSGSVDYTPHETTAP